MSRYLIVEHVKATIMETVCDASLNIVLVSSKFSHHLFLKSGEYFQFFLPTKNCVLRSKPWKVVIVDL